jgi:hypothetical protein
VEKSSPKRERIFAIGAEKYWKRERVVAEYPTFVPKAVTTIESIHY